jgi:hypothetical protein
VASLTAPSGYDRVWSSNLALTQGGCFRWLLLQPYCLHQSSPPARPRVSTMCAGRRGHTVAAPAEPQTTGVMIHVRVPDCPRRACRNDRCSRRPNGQPPRIRRHACYRCRHLGSARRPRRGESGVAPRSRARYQLHRHRRVVRPPHQRRAHPRGRSTRTQAIW